MEEKKVTKVSGAVVFLIIVLIVAMGFCIFKLYKDKTNTAEEATNLNNQTAISQNNETSNNDKDTNKNTDSVNVKVECKTDSDSNAEILDKFWINNKNVLDSMFDKTHSKYLKLISKKVSDNLVFANISLYGAQFDTNYLFVYNDDGELIDCFDKINDEDNDNNKYKYNGHFEYDSDNKMLTFNTSIWLGEGEESSGAAFNDKEIPDLSKKELERLLNYADEVKYEYKYENGKFNLVKKNAITQLKDNEFFKGYIK